MSHEWSPVKTKELAKNLERLMLENPRSIDQETVARLGEHAGPDTPQAIEVLIKLTRHNEYKVRTAAAEALASIRQRTEPETSWLYQLFLRLLDRSLGSDESRGSWSSPSDLHGTLLLLRVSLSILHPSNGAKILNRTIPNFAHPSIRELAIEAAATIGHRDTLKLLLGAALDRSDTGLTVTRTERDRERALQQKAWISLLSLAETMPVTELTEFLSVYLAGEVNRTAGQNSAQDQETRERAERNVRHFGHLLELIGQRLVELGDDATDEQGV